MGFPAAVVEVNVHTGHNTYWCSEVVLHLLVLYLLLSLCRVSPSELLYCCRMPFNFMRMAEMEERQLVMSRKGITVIHLTLVISMTTSTNWMQVRMNYTTQHAHVNTSSPPPYQLCLLLYSCAWCESATLKTTPISPLCN